MNLGVVECCSGAETNWGEVVLIPSHFFEIASGLTGQHGLKTSALTPRLPVIGDSVTKAMFRF
jgi:hypothetical protein